MTQQKMQEAVVTVVTRKFPELESLARTNIALIDDLEHLSQVLLGLAYLDTREDVEQFLLRLSEDALKEKRRDKRAHPVSMFDSVDPMYELIMVNAFAKGYSQSLQRRIQAGSVEMEQAIRWSVEQGVEQGLQRSAQTLQATAIDVVESKFPELLSLAQRSITSVNNLQRLQQQVLDLSTLSSRDEVREYLLSLFTDPLYKDLLEKGGKELIGATRKAAITAVVKRFPCSWRLPQESHAGADHSQPPQSMLELGYLPSQEEVEKFLLSLFAEPCYAELPEDEVQKLSQMVQQEAIDRAESLQAKYRRNNSEVQKTIQEAIREGAKLGLRLGTESVGQAVYARFLVRYRDRESLAPTATRIISAPNWLSCFRERIWDLCTMFEAERHLSEDESE